MAGYYGAPPYGGYAGAPQPYSAAPTYGAPPPYGGEDYSAWPRDNDPVRTIFISGFPQDIKERELNNLLRYVPGYVASQMSWKGGQAHGFGLFTSPAAAHQACMSIQGVQFDEISVLRCEMARKNMFTGDDGVGPAGPGAKRQRFEGGGYGPGAPAAGGGGGGGGYARGGPGSGGGGGLPGDNPPCSTLFIGNLGDGVTEEDLQNLMSTQPGFKQLKVLRGGRSVTGFAEFADVSAAMAVHQSLQGATVPSSDRGGIRIQYSKNPFGKRRD